MHACGHDVNITCLVGTARMLSAMKEKWSGTLVFIGQPAEEIGAGSRMMLADGLFHRFPRPDFCLATHCDSRYAHGHVYPGPEPEGTRSGSPRRQAARFREAGEVKLQLTVRTTTDEVGRPRPRTCRSARPPRRSDQRFSSGSCRRRAEHSRKRAAELTRRASQ